MYLFSNDPYGYVQFIGKWQVGIGRGDGRCGGRLGICACVRSRAQTLLGLLNLATEGIGRCGAVLAGVLVSKTWP